MKNLNFLFCIFKISDGNPAKKSADSDSGFFCIFSALRILIPVLDSNFNNINILISKYEKNTLSGSSKPGQMTKHFSHEINILKFKYLC